MNTFKHINVGFTRTQADYRKNISFWKDNIFKVIDKSQFKEWLINKTNDSSFKLNGNPAFSLIRQDKVKALRIMQLEPRSGKPYIAAWTEAWDDGEQHADILAIGLELSNITLTAAINLIEAWFNDKNTFHNFLRHYNETYKKNYTPSAEEMAFELYEKISKINALSITHIKPNAKIISSRTIDEFRNINNLTHNVGSALRVYDLAGITSIIRIYQNLTALSGIIEVDDTIHFPSAKITPNFQKKYTSCIKARYSFSTFNKYFSSYKDELHKVNDELYKELLEKNSE